MTSTTFFIIFIPILAGLLLAINLVLAPHNPYQEKDSAFECGFKSFYGQNRTEFNISFFIFGLLFLLFDLEILLVYPYSVSSYTNDIYGLVIMMVFFVLLTLGFIFELGKNALTIDSRQTSSYDEVELSTPHACISTVSSVLYAMGINMENFVYRIPSGSKLATLSNGSNYELSDKISIISQTIQKYRNDIVVQAERELQAPNLSQADISEINSYITSAEAALVNGLETLSQSVNIALAIIL